jgi:CubicO group peptidase (beta-lactamase class C family)
MKRMGTKINRTPACPETEWVSLSPNEAGFDSEKLYNVRRWLDDRVGNGSYRIVIVRNGGLVAEWNHGFYSKTRLSMPASAKSVVSLNLRTVSQPFLFKRRNAFARNTHLPLASAAKSVFSCILGIAIQEGKIPSADAKIAEFYPEAMDVSEGEGPKPDRHAFQKDREITFRQLISNTSGYMKPGEEPGKVFHYQTYGMNILTHAIAKSYGLYDVQDPEGSPGFKQLVDEKLRIPIGASWSYSLMNFNLHPKARINIFGFYDGVNATALDMARLGWLWCNRGHWAGKQIVPESWMREATKTAPDITANCPKEQWKYGYGFWTNDHSQLWPGLPSDSFAASGAGAQHIWVCPSLDLVVVQSPGVLKNRAEKITEFISLILNACT